MKRVIFILSFFLCIASVNAQKDYVYEVFPTDTLTNDTTMYFTFPETIRGLYEYEFQVLVDSLSGDTEGTVKLQQCNDLAGEDWTDVSGKTSAITKAIPGMLWNGVAYGTNYRVCVNSAETQSTKLRISAVFKKVGGRNGEKDYMVKVFATDSTDAAESIYFEFPTAIRGRYYYSWHIVSDESTGSATATAQLQESCDNSGDLWYDVTGESDAKTEDGSAFIEGTAVYGSNQRLKITQSAAGKWYYKVVVSYKKIE